MNDLFEKPMVSNGRVACDICGQQLFEGEEFDIDEDGNIICENCHKNE